MVHVFGHSPKGWNPTLELAVPNVVPPSHVAQLRVAWAVRLTGVILRLAIADLLVEEIIDVFFNESFPSWARRLRTIITLRGDAARRAGDLAASRA